MKGAARRGGGILIAVGADRGRGAGGAEAGFGPARNGVIVFERQVEGVTDLFTINPDGSGEFNLTTTPGLVAGLAAAAPLRPPHRHDRRG